MDGMKAELCKIKGEETDREDAREVEKKKNGKMVIQTLQLVYSGHIGQF